MRLWTVHPAALDRAALVACWREGLLAQAVLLGRTRGYTRHPQLDRFRAADDPAATIAAFLLPLAAEADVRGYRFDRSRVEREPAAAAIAVTLGQLEFEWEHLRRKVAARAPGELVRLAPAARAHPLFEVVPGGIEAWERGA